MTLNTIIMYYALALQLGLFISAALMPKHKSRVRMAIIAIALTPIIAKLWGVV